MANLPTESEPRFTDAFIPLWYDYIGTLENPWDTPNTILQGIQKIWDQVYPDINHQIGDENDIVYHMVTDSFLASVLSLTHGNSYRQ